MRITAIPRIEYESQRWMGGDRTGFRHADHLFLSLASHCDWEALTADTQRAAFAFGNGKMARVEDADEFAGHAPKTLQQLWQESIARSHAQRAREHAGLPEPESDE